MADRWVRQLMWGEAWLLTRGGGAVGGVRRSAAHPSRWFAYVLGGPSRYVRGRAAAMRAVTSRTDPKKGYGL
jgi:hypothetical protein